MAEHRSFPCSFCLVENKSAATWVVQFKSSSRGKKDAEHGEQGLRAKKVGRGRKILSELEDCEDVISAFILSDHPCLPPVGEGQTDYGKVASRIPNLIYAFHYTVLILPD